LSAILNGKRAVTPLMACAFRRRCSDVAQVTACCWYLWRPTRPRSQEDRET